jgi:hypothetical protein
MAAAGFNPADDEQRIGTFEDFDVDVGGVERRQGFGGLHFCRFLKLVRFRPWQ